MDPDELVACADLNLTEWVREQARFSRTASLTEHHDALFALGSTGFPVGPFNCAVPLVDGLSEAQAIDWVTRANAFFASAKRGFTVQIRGARDAAVERACENAGLVMVSDSPGMVLERSIDDAPLPQGAAMRVVRDARAITDLVDVVGAGYETMGMPRDIAPQVFTAPESMLRPHWHMVVADLDGVPSATAMAFLSHGIGGVYWVATRPAARGRGLAAACTRAVSRWCFARGARAVVLQASPGGQPVYARMGYRVFDRYPWLYGRPPRA